MAKRDVDPVEMLDRLFRVIRQEAASNPRFAAGLLEAFDTGASVRARAARPAIDPVLVAMRGPEEFRSTFLAYSSAELKAVIRSYALVSTAELKGKSRVPQLVDMMWAGAVAQLHDRGFNRTANARRRD